MEEEELIFKNIKGENLPIKGEYIKKKKIEEQFVKKIGQKLMQIFLLNIIIIPIMLLET